jgi:hypothetical protein
MRSFTFTYEDAVMKQEVTITLPTWLVEALVAQRRAALAPAPSNAFVGVKTVYHRTNREAALNAIREGRMRAGNYGMWGPGIYFADSIGATEGKSQHGNDAVLMVTADFGTARVLHCAARDRYTPFPLANTGCQSIMGRGTPSSAWEYVLFDPSRISSIKMV